MRAWIRGGGGDDVYIGMGMGLISWASSRLCIHGAGCFDLYAEFGA